jgi:hypothetical protein
MPQQEQVSADFQLSRLRRRIFAPMPGQFGLSWSIYFPVAAEFSHSRTISQKYLRKIARY